MEDYSEVAEPCEEYNQMVPDWNLADALWGGVFNWVCNLDTLFS